MKSLRVPQAELDRLLSETHCTVATDPLARRRPVAPGPAPPPVPKPVAAGPLPILALDLGTKTGWASEAGSGVEDFGPKRDHHAITRQQMIFDGFQCWLARQLVPAEPGAVVPAVLVLEGLVGKSLQGQAARVLLGLRALALLAARRRELLIDEVPPATWQAWARPQGWVKGDEADAVALRRYWLAMRAGSVKVAA